jgi:hypothetical protein
MNWTNPAALAFALLAVPIVLLYLLRMRRRSRPVSSTLLWRQVLLDREANTLWQRLRRNLLLFLQLAALAALVAALVGPYLITEDRPRGAVIVLLDASASMQATDITPSRFEAARAQARAWIDDMTSADRMQLILVDGAPRAISPLTGDRAALLAALNAAAPSASAARWPAAVAAAGAAAEFAPDAQLAVLTDGADLDDSDDSDAFAALRAPLRFYIYGANGDNLSVAPPRLRRTASGLAAFVRVTNHGARAQPARLTLAADSDALPVREITVPAGASTDLTIDRLPSETTSVVVRLDAADGNALAIDDEAWAAAPPRAARRAMLATSGSRFLAQALAALPGWQNVRTAASPDPAQPFDLYVLDGFTATIPAAAGVLYVGVTPHFTPTGYFTDTRLLRAEPHPILDGVDWGTVAVQGAQRFEAPAWLRPVLFGEGGPLLYAGVDPDGRRVVVLPFPLSRSDLPLRIAFPLLIANAAEWLAPRENAGIGGLAQSMLPGEAVALPVGAAVTLPNGARRTVDAPGFAETQQTGLYRVEYDRASGTFAVHLDPAESSLTPTSPLTPNPSPLSPLPSSLSPNPSPLWPWAAGAALLLLLIEWWVDRRGVGEPTPHPPAPLSPSISRRSSLINARTSARNFGGEGEGGGEGVRG